MIIIRRAAHVPGTSPAASRPESAAAGREAALGSGEGADRGGVDRELEACVQGRMWDREQAGMRGRRCCAPLGRECVVRRRSPRVCVCVAVGRGLEERRRGVCGGRAESRAAVRDTREADSDQIKDMLKQASVGNARGWAERRRREAAARLRRRAERMLPLLVRRFVRGAAGATVSRPPRAGGSTAACLELLLCVCYTRV